MGQLTPNFNFVMPYESEYYSIGTVNANINAIDTAIMKKSRREYIAAAANSSASMKKKADVVCTATDAAQRIQELINAASDGDTIRLCAGSYDIYPDTENGIIINKRIEITGSGNGTVVSHKGLALDSQRGGATFRAAHSEAVIKNMMLVNYKEASNTAAMIDLAADGAEIRQVFFIQNIVNGYTGYCVKNSANTRFVRIEDCRIFRERSVNTMPMFDFGGYDFSGIVGGMISSGADGLIMRFKDTASENNTEIYACGNVNIL